MINRAFIAWVGAAVLALTTLPLPADVLPPPDYVETCTLEQQQGAGEECRICQASFMGRDDCLRLGAEGFEHRCRAYGASIWTELWCRTESKPGTGS